jgi:hypothetical protein
MTTQQIAKLNRIIRIASKLLAETKREAAGSSRTTKKRKSGKRIRRSGKELVRFRKMLRAERRKGVAVSDLARRHGVSSAYIYMLP